MECGRAWPEEANGDCCLPLPELSVISGPVTVSGAPRDAPHLVLLFAVRV